MSPTAELEVKIAIEVRRLVDRLATLTATRLAEPAPPYTSRAMAAHALAQRFVDVTADVEDHAPIPSLPWIDELTVVDQLVVTAQDLKTALAARDTSGANIARLTELLEDIRRVRAAVR